MAGAVDTSVATIVAGVPRLRQRKISVKQRLRILWERDLPDLVEDVRSDLLGITETGVDKSEEDERHLQAVLSASNVAPNQDKGNSTVFIPTPNASTKWAEYSRYYHPGWVESTSYIHSSATVEDALGCEFNMDEDDAEFLERLNKATPDAKQKCSEDEFEMLCALFETVVAEKQPYIATDVSQLLPYNELEVHIVANLEARRRNAKNPQDPEQLLYEAHSEDYAPRFAPSPYRTPLASVRTFGKKVYEHWRERKLKAHGRSVFPSLKFETGLASDDSDPYVCFRRRELRHTRKTRRTDQQNSGRLRKLHAEMQSARSLLELILNRERTRLSQIQTDFEIFEARCRVKALKRKIGGADDPELAGLLVSIPKRVRKEEAAKARREERERERRERLAQEKAERAQQHAASASAASSSSAAAASASAASGAGSKPKPSAPAAAGSRIPDLDHLTITQYRLDKDAAIQQAIAKTMQDRAAADADWVNLTESALVPHAEFFADHSLQPLTTDSIFSSLVYTMSGALDGMRASTPRMELPLSIDVPVTETPEIISATADGGIARFGEIDFARDPDRFSIPRDGPQVSVRHRSAGGVHYFDRVLSERSAHDKFVEEFVADPQSAEDERLVDRFKFDHNDVDYCGRRDPNAALKQILDEVAPLNDLRPETQTLRFGSMLTKKSEQLVYEAQRAWDRNMALKRQSQQQALAQRRALAQQQQNQLQQQRAATQQQQAHLRVQHARKFAQKQALRDNVPQSAQPHASGSPTAGSPKTTTPLSSVVRNGSPAPIHGLSGKQSGKHPGGASGKQNGAVNGRHASSPAQNTKGLTPQTPQPPKIEAGG